jgi:EAL domain-containing protein
MPLMRAICMAKSIKSIAVLLHDPFGGHWCSGFLAHLHSSMVTMSQKSSVLQAAKFVSLALTPDIGIESTAEGVETSAQLEWLRSGSCTEVQGFLFSPPKRAEQLPQLLAEQKLRSISSNFASKGEYCQGGAGPTSGSKQSRKLPQLTRVEIGYGPIDEAAAAPGDEIVSVDLDQSLLGLFRA